MTVLLSEIQVGFHLNISASPSDDFEFVLEAIKLVRHKPGAVGAVPS
jgi:hypothetical protein